jgi:hypothetical protein
MFSLFPKIFSYISLSYLSFSKTNFPTIFLSTSLLFFQKLKNIIFRKNTVLIKKFKKIYLNDIDKNTTNLIYDDI